MSALGGSGRAAGSIRSQMTHRDNPARVTRGFLSEIDDGALDPEENGDCSSELDRVITRNDRIADATGNLRKG